VSELSALIAHRRDCLNELERLIGTDPPDCGGRAALALARCCLKHVCEHRDLDKLYAHLHALAPDSARAGDGAPALAGPGVGGL
jgi:hypothetical protein